MLAFFCGYAIICAEIMTEIKYSKKGTTWAIEIQGDSQQEITERFWSFWNHGATDGEFHWLNEFRGYFWTDEKRFSKSLENIFLFKMLNESDELREQDPEGWAHCCKGLKGGFLPRAKELAKEALDSLEAAEYFGRFSDALDFQYSWNDQREANPLLRECNKSGEIN